MRGKRIFNTARALPRMSWEPINLFNLWQRSLGPVSGRDQVTFKKTDLSLFKQRWRSKRLVRAYHGDYIQEKRFKRWWLPELLPDIRTRRPNKATELLRIANRPKDALKYEEDAKAQDEALARAPVGSLMFQEIERRLDTLVFRACFASSIYKARQLVLHGHVKLNGAKCIKPGRRLEPGDLFSVDPAYIPFLNYVHPAAAGAAETTKRNGEEGTSAEAAPTEGATESSSAEAKEESVVEKNESEDDSKSWEAVRAERRSKALDMVLGKPTFRLPDYAAPCIFIPAYLETSFATCSAIYVRHPMAREGYSELPTPYDADGEVMRLAWEWYNQVRPRTRGRIQRETGPHGTRRPVLYWSFYQK